MKKNILSFFIILIFYSCLSRESCNEDKLWRLKWRTILSFEFHENEIGFQQLDSLLLRSKFIDNLVLNLALTATKEEEMENRIQELFFYSTDKYDLCMSLEIEHPLCKSYDFSNLANHPVAKKIAQHYVFDQYHRGVVLEEIINFYDIDTLLYSSIIDKIDIDIYNQNGIKTIIDSIGIPSHKEIGRTGYRHFFNSTTFKRFRLAKTDFFNVKRTNIQWKRIFRSHGIS